MKIAPDLMSAFLNPRTKGNDKSHLEHYLFKTKSEQLGGYLLHFWGFPLPIIEGVLNHDDPEKLMESDFSPACAVYIANSILSGKAVNEEFAAHFDLESTLAVLEQNHQV
jgi:HD-like signal output (HDOD) protein